MITSLWYLTRYPYTQLVDPEADSPYLREFAAGEIVRPGPDESALIVLSGHIRILHAGEQEPVTLELLNPRDVLGWLKDSTAGAAVEAIAMDACSVYELPRHMVERRARADGLPAIDAQIGPTGPRKMLRVEVKDLLFQPAEVRVARALLLLLEPGRREAVGELTRCLALPVWRLAELAGLGREALKVQLSEWVRMGWVETAWGAIRAIRSDALRGIAGLDEPHDVLPILEIGAHRNASRNGAALEAEPQGQVSGQKR